MRPGAAWAWASDRRERRSMRFGVNEIERDCMSPPTLRLLELDAPWRHPELIAQVDAIFWQTAARTFPPGAERDAFRERWLGRYLEGGSDVVLVALADGAGVVGY